MVVNEFTECSSQLSNSDLESLERLVGMPLSEEFRSHYLKWNGGSPALDWCPLPAGAEPIWIQSFLPILATSEDASADELSVQQAYEKGIAKEIIQFGWLPFAIDPGANLICIHLKDQSIWFHPGDGWDSNATPQKNRQRLGRRLAVDFREFVASLVSEDEAFD